MKPHPHAEVLRAIADGVPPREFEVLNIYWDDKNWEGALFYTGWIGNPESWKVRRKTQHIMVNGFKVPKPLEVAEKRPHSVFVPDTMSEIFWNDWVIEENIDRAIERGIAHTTKEAAIAHAKAMLGIDPEAA